MENKQRLLYEYAMVRYVPCIERGEFINIGLIMMCKRAKWIKAQFVINKERVLALCPDADLDTLNIQIEGIIKVADGDNSKKADSISSLTEVHERFRWLTAVKSASIQTSRPHVGLCGDLDDTFNRLFNTLIK